MDLDSVVRRRDEPIFTRLDDELLALDPRQGYCYSLSGVGTRVWELISSPTAIGTVRDRLVMEFAVDEDTCLTDLLGLIRDLDAAGLVELSVSA
jgi:Coenzyme PQQ synthesis protein D (PqqD)